jgi:multiple sugar transport system substrate-binding protein
MQERRLGRREFLRLSGVTAAGLALAACSPGGAANPAGGPSLKVPAADTKANLTIFNFGGDNDKKVYADAEARFMKRYPNVTITDTFVPVDTWGNFTNKFSTAIAGGQVLDVLNIAIEGTRMVVTKNVLRPIDDLMADANSADLVGDVAPALSNSLKYKGRNYLVPNSWNNMCIHYNTKIFKDAGIAPPKEDWTWDDFLAIAKQLTTGEGDKKVWGFGIPAFNFGLQPWFLTNLGTGTLTDDWTKSQLGDPKSIEAMQFVYDLVYKHKVSPTVEGTANDQLFSAGKMAMTGFGHWTIQTYQANKFKDFDVQYWPKKTGSTSVFGVGGWGIPTTSKNPALAWELIKDLNSSDTMKATAQAGVAIPARRSIGESAEFTSVPANAKIFYGCLKDAKPVPAPSNFAEVEQIYMRHFTEMMGGSVMPDVAMKAADKELADAMAKVKD